jgi:single-strand DNA-binding protein
MASFNQVSFAGHLTADPIVKKIGEGKVASFTVAANRKSKKRDGTISEEVCFLEVEAWGFHAETAEKYLNKGIGVFTNGRLKQSRWQAKDGTERTKLVLACDNLLVIASPNASSSTPPKSAAPPARAFTSKGLISDADESPF